MKIRKYIIVLILLPLFLGVGYADDNVSVKSSVSSPDPKDDCKDDCAIIKLSN
jgi:hypothetical protein